MSKKRRFQFSLASLFLLMTVAAFVAVLPELLHLAIYTILLVLAVIVCLICFFVFMYLPIALVMNKWFPRQKTLKREEQP